VHSPFLEIHRKQYTSRKNIQVAHHFHLFKYP
jgi:hypothetical protein